MHGRWYSLRDVVRGYVTLGMDVLVGRSISLGWARTCCNRKRLLVSFIDSASSGHSLASKVTGVGTVQGL